MGEEVKNDMMNDFMVVACASLHELDLAVSDDNRTMLSEFAIKSYKIENSLRRYRTPNFIGYGEFRRLLA